jgi:GcrA cell cycle regulator
MLLHSITNPAAPGNGSGWTDTRVERLKAFWADGLSASVIADRLGEVTRNAVIGKVHRLGLAGRKTASRASTTRPRATFPSRPDAARIVASPCQRVRRAAPRQPVRVIPLRALPDIGPAPEEIVGLGELQDGMCHWPVGDPLEVGFHFCGRTKTVRLPYCEHHAAIAYNPAARRRRAA